MKSKLLYFSVVVFALSLSQANAQDVSYSTSGLTLGTPANGNSGSNLLVDASTGITISQVALEAKSDGLNGTMLEIASNNNTLSPTSENLSITSSTRAITKIVLSYRSNTAGTPANPLIKFGSSASDVTGCRLDAVGGGSVGNVIDDVTYTFDAGTKYIIMGRANGIACDTRTSSQITIRLFKIEVYLEGTAPLDFLSFNAKADAFGKTVALNWSTTNEINTKSFEIQKRTDGTEFASIGTLASKNIAGIHNYSFKDNNVGVGNIYYRIVQFDNDGTSTISKVQAITTKAPASLSIYPNPTVDFLNISHDAAKAGAIVKVIAMDGKSVLQQELSVNSTDTKLDVSQLNSGNYLLILTTQDQKSSLKFVKR